MVRKEHKPSWKSKGISISWDWILENWVENLATLFGKNFEIFIHYFIFENKCWLVLTINSWHHCEHLLQWCKSPKKIKAMSNWDQWSRNNILSLNLLLRLLINSSVFITGFTNAEHSLLRSLHVGEGWYCIGLCSMHGN